MRKIDILRIIHRYLKDSTVDKISGGLENKNLGLMRLSLKESSITKYLTEIGNNKFIKFFISTNKTPHIGSGLKITYNPELDYCFIGNIQFQLSDLKDAPDEILILSYGRSILEEIKP